MTRPIQRPALTPVRRLLTVSLLFGFSAHAAPVYSWSDCVDLAKKNNAVLRAAEADLRSTQSQEGVSRSGFLPEVSANLSYTRGNTSVNLSGSDPNNFSSSNNSGRYSATLSGSWNLFSGFQDQGRLSQAKANTDAQNASLQSTKAQVSYDLKSAYEGFVYAKEYAKLTTDIIDRREENLRMVELRFQSGLENKGSVLLSQANADQAKYDHLQAQHAQRVARAQLARELGLDEYDTFDVQGEIPVTNAPQSLPDLKALALETPEVLQATAKEESAFQAIRVSRAGFFPSLDLTGSMGRQGPDFFPDERNSWSVGLNLSLPIFSGGKDYYGVRSASASWASAASTDENTRRDVLAKLEQAYSTYVEAVMKLKVDQSYRNASTTRAEIARKQYNNGLITFNDWNIIEDDLISRQKSYLQSQRDRVVAEAAYEQVQGKGVIP